MVPSHSVVDKWLITDVSYVWHLFSIRLNKYYMALIQWNILRR